MPEEGPVLDANDLTGNERADRLVPYLFAFCSIRVDAIAFAEIEQCRLQEEPLQLSREEIR